MLEKRNLSVYKTFISFWSPEVALISLKSIINKCFFFVFRPQTPQLPAPVQCEAGPSVAKLVTEVSTQYVKYLLTYFLLRC